MSVLDDLETGNFAVSLIKTLLQVFKASSDLLSLLSSWNTTLLLYHYTNCGAEYINYGAKGAIYGAEPRQLRIGTTPIKLSYFIFVRLQSEFSLITGSKPSWAVRQ